LDRPDHLGQPVIGRALARLFRALVLPVALIGLTLFALFTAMDHFAALEDADSSQEAVADPTGPRQADPGQPAEGTKETAAARQVNPSRFGLPFTRNPDELVRLPPRPPLSEPPEEEAEEKSGELLYRPLVLGAGLLSFSGRNLELAGIEPTPANRFCDTADGGQWPCGMIARTSFRALIRGRAVECDVEDAEWEGTAVAPCSLNGDDLARWLVAQGWAEAASGSPYAELEAAARAEKRGLFGADPR
jgi:endonuclease YncB( thermonuclease family)